MNDFWSGLTRPGIEGALGRYKLMAYIVGSGLIILVFIGIPLQAWAGAPQVARYVGVAHGFLYIAYLMAALDLARRARFTLLQMAAMVGAGFLPFLAFIIERRVERRVREVLTLNAQEPEADLNSAAQ
jgi:integral membrane protein